MAIETYAVANGFNSVSDPDGAVIVDTVTGIPLPVSVKAFDDESAAERFVAWATRDGLELRGISATRLAELVLAWTTGRLSKEMLAHPSDETWEKVVVHGHDNPDEIRDLVGEFLWCEADEKGPLELTDGKLHVYAGTCPYAEDIYNEEQWVFNLSKTGLEQDLYEAAQDI